MEQDIRSVNYGKAGHSSNAPCMICKKDCIDEQMYVIIEHRCTVVWSTFVCEDCLNTSLGLLKFLNYTIVQKSENNRDKIINKQLTNEEEAEKCAAQYG
jgi:hypothetical protein